MIENIILGLSLAMPIGPASIAVIKSGLKYGFPSAFLVSLGVATADTTFMLVVYLGLVNFISVEIVKTLIWLLGAIILLWLGCKSIKEFFEGIHLNKSRIKMDRNSFLVGYIVNISNPMALAWWFGVFGSILASSNQNGFGRASLLDSFTIITGILAWLSFLSFLTHWGQKFLNEKTTKYISVIGGFFLIGFGFRFGYNALISLLR